MTGRGPQNILRGHKITLNLIKGGGAANYYYTFKGGKKVKQRLHLGNKISI